MSRLGRNYAYRQVRARLIKDALVCSICGRALDHWGDPRGPRAPSVDHLMPVKALKTLHPRDAEALAVDPNNMRVCCLHCNASRGAGRAKPTHVSRQW